VYAVHLLIRPRTDFIVSSTRRTSIATGALLIIATLAALAADPLGPALAGTGYLTAVADHPKRLAGAALLYLIGAGTSVGIAIALYPLLKTVNGALALGSVVFRTIEAVFYTAAVVSLLSILPLGQQLATASGDNRAPMQALADTLLSMRDHSTLVGVFAFSLGALMYYALFYRSRLVPRWLSGWGMAAALLMLTACLLALFSNSPVTGYVPLILPIALQEMVLAVWLLVKGFSPSPDSGGAASEARPLLAWR
jgi:MFS family permease